MITPAFLSGVTLIRIVSDDVPQIFVSVYVTIVLPPEIPETVPAALTEAIAALAVVQVPPEGVSFNTVVAFWQTVLLPVIVPATGAEVTVID